MSKFNFDSEFFRRVISKCEKTKKIPLLSQMVRDAVELFYDEFDYYPEVAVYAPGTFTIMGDHLEYVKGNLVQGALPMRTVVVGKSLCSIKCRLVTTSKDVEGLRRSVFPIYHYKKNLKVFPEWVNYIKGVINSFPYEDLKGFDAVIHSNVPCFQGYGSSASLQVGFYTFLEAFTGINFSDKKEEKGSLCQLAERPTQMCQYKMGQWSNFTSAVAVEKTAVRINCRTREISSINLRDIDILFLLTFPNFEIELNDRDYVPRREMELKLIAKLLGLEEVIDATEQDLEVLANMEDPSRETLEAILRGFGYDEDCIAEYLDELYYFPKPESIFDEHFYYTEGEFYPGEIMSNDQDSITEYLLRGEADQEDTEVKVGPCTLAREIQQQKSAIPKPPPVSYIQERIAELCAGKIGSQNSLPKRICEEINCLGGIENLSVDSDLTVTGRLLRRLRHVITENKRSLELSDILSHLDYVEFGTKLIQSHLSLKIDFEVSCPTLDGLVQLAIDTDRVYGAKMTSGGGTLTLLHRSVVEEFIDKVIEKYGDDFQFYLVFPGSGAQIVNVGIKKNPKSSLSNTYLTLDELMKRAIENFQISYKYSPTHGSYSPGCVNIVGDHTDFNHGLCLSLALNLLTVVVGAFNGTSKIRVCTTADVGEEKNKVIFSLPEFEELKPGKLKWVKLIKGTIAHFKGTIKGFDCLIESNLPCSVGLGSRSALITAFYTFLEELTGQKTKKVSEKAYSCMLAVQEFSNVLCGISDHISLMRSKKDSLVYVNCKSGASTVIPFHDPSITILLTLVKLDPTPTKSILYTRMEECYNVAKALGARTLRCLNLKDLEVLKCSKVPESSIRRAQHVITENERVLRATEALKNNDYEALGEIMVASHNSLRDQFELSRPELDHLIKCAMEVDGVFGSKITCGDYPTCTITLVKRWAVDDVIEYLQKNFSGTLFFYMVNPHVHSKPLEVKKYLEAHPSTQIVFENIFPF